MPFTPLVGTLVYLLDRAGERVLMIRRDARPDDDHYGKVNGLGGKLEPDEDVISSLRREIHDVCDAGLGKQTVDEFLVVDAAFPEFEVRFTFETGEPVALQLNGIVVVDVVDTDNRGSLAQESRCEMTPDEPRCSCHQYAHSVAQAPLPIRFLLFCASSSCLKRLGTLLSSGKLGRLPQ